MGIKSRAIILINLIYFILSQDMNNNENLKNKNNIKLKLIDDGINNFDFKCLRVFSGVEYPDRVYLNDKEIDLQQNGSINISRNDFSHTYLVILEWNKTIDTCQSFFNSLKGIIEIDLSEFDASEVTSMHSMFYQCEDLTNIKFGNINTTSLIDMSFMFSYCYSLYSIDLSNFDTSKVTKMTALFIECKSLISLNISYLNTSKVGDFFYFFYGCKSLISIDLSKFDTSSATNMNYMFYKLESCTSLDLSTFNTSNVYFMDFMFYESTSIININLTGFDTSNVHTMEYMFSKCNSLKSLDLSSFTFNESNINYFFLDCNSLTSIKFPKTKKLIETAKSMFKNCFSLLSVDLYNFDFEIIEDLSYFFYGCKSLTSINLSYINTFSITNMEYMFYGCNSLTELNLKNWITSSVSNINSMFSSCILLISLDLSNFDTSLVRDMKNLFLNCVKLTSVNLANFETKKVTTMESMFYGCISLLSLNLSSFDISKVVYMNSMFYNCMKLTSLDLSNFNFQIDTNMENMFNGCTNLGYINFYNYNNQPLIDNIFFGIQDNLILCIKKESNKEKMNFELSKLKCPIINCSNNWKEYKKRIIYNNDTCIKDCKEDDNYKYEFEYYCYDKCPKGTHSTINNNYLCEKNLDKCNKKYPFLLTGNYSCAENCTAEDFFKEKCTFNVHNIESKGIIIRNIISDIENNLMNIIISKYLDDRKDIIIKKNETIYQITSSWNQNNKQYKNISYIKLKDCENILKAKYGILSDEILIIFKIEQKIEGLLIPLIEYEIFNPKTKEKLDLSHYKNENIYIDIYMPVSINENILYKYNPNNSYYNDICDTSTTEYGTDITLYERKIQYNNHNYFLCPVNCQYINYDLENKTVICQCEPQNGISLNKTKVINYFKNLKYTTNFKVLKCLKLLFKFGLIKNIANYIISSIIILYIILAIFFYCKEYKLLCIKIYEIIRIKKNMKINIKEDLNNKNPSNENAFKFKRNKKTNKNFYLFNSFIKINSDNSKTNLNKKIRKERDIIETNEKKYYEDYEINNINYEEAIKRDKRTYCQIYLSLIKVNHILFFTFFSKEDYNPRSIKICSFFFMFVLHMFINTLFFNDAIMNKINKNKGIFNFIDILPQIIYSIIICTLIKNIIKQLSLSQKNILEIKNENNISNLNLKIINVMRCIKNKFILFFIFSFIFLVFFWCYLSCFCFVYNNTQIYLFKVILISYVISFIYPLVIYLFHGIFRIASFKNLGKYFYKISILLKLL